MLKDRTSIHTALLCVIVCLAAWLRVIGSCDKGLWYDEVVSLEYSTALGGYDKLVMGAVMESPPDLTGLRSAKPWWKIWTSLRHATHPPLYFVMLRWWRELFGESEAAARSLSVVCSLTALLCLFIVSRTLHGPVVALHATLFMAVAVTQVVFAQEARSYTMAIALALASTVALLRLQMHGASVFRVGGLMLGLSCLLLTHYLGFSVFVALGLYATITCRHGRHRWALLSFGTALFFFLVLWGSVLMSQWTNFSTYFRGWIVDQRPGHIIRALGLLAAFPVRAFVEIPGFMKPFSSPSWLSIVAGMMMWSLLLKLVIDRRDATWLLWALWAALHVSFLLLQDLREDLQHSTSFLAVSRYIFIATPAVYGFVALATARLRPAWQCSVFAGVALAGLLAVPRTVARVEKENWRGVAAYLDNVVTPGDVLVYESLAWYPGNYFRRLFSGTFYYMHHHPPTLLMNRGPLGQRTLDRLKASSAIWVVTPSLSQRARDLLADFTIQDRRDFGVRDEVYRMRWTGR